MRWQLGRRSTNIEDRRGMGGGGGLALGGGTVLLIALVASLFGVDPRLVLEGLEQVQVQTQGDAPSVEPGSPQDEQGDFVAAVLGDTEDTWSKLLVDSDLQYEAPRLVLFDGSVQSACGFTSAAVGPFYCPLDRKVYIDLSFFQDLDRRFGAPGDFARAYVIAHEVGHHIQTLIGVSERVRMAQSRASESERNAISVLQELQADCFAGVWGHHAGKYRNLLEEGDVEEGLAAAAAIGDDRLQRKSGNTVQPESWTHGSSEQRVQWLRRGLQTGRPSDCNTFASQSR